MRWAPEGYKRGGDQPLALRTHHQDILTTMRTPTTGEPPNTSSESTTGSKGGDIFSLTSSLALFLAFWAHKGNVGMSLSTCYILWFCEIRHCVVETFC